MLVAIKIYNAGPVSNNIDDYCQLLLSSNKKIKYYFLSENNKLNTAMIRNIGITDATNDIIPPIIYGRQKRKTKKPIIPIIS